MPLYKTVLLLLVIGLLVYEALAVWLHWYPPITATVAAWPFGAVVVLALVLGWMAVHFIRAHDRRHR